MGYVHDIHLDLDFDRSAFSAAVADIRELFRRSEVRIAGPSGRPATMPVLDDDLIGFNGVNLNCVCDPRDSDYNRMMRCRYGSCHSAGVNSVIGQPFVIDLRPGHPYGISEHQGRYWIDCKTFRRRYDHAAMIAPKHHLGDQAEMHSKGRWGIEWSHGGDAWDWFVGRRLPGAVEVYTHVFPDRAPVRNILDSEGIGW